VQRAFQIFRTESQKLQNEEVLAVLCLLCLSHLHSVCVYMYLMYQSGTFLMCALAAYVQRVRSNG
jgi:hypothetical protein